MLERIKHLFDIEGLVFVLAINTEQLATGFQGVYGPNFDGKKYLRRFIDFEYKLKNPDLERYIKFAMERLDIQEIDQRRGLGGGLIAIQKAIYIMASHLGYQARDVNQLVTRLSLAMRAVPSGDTLYPILVVTLLFLRSENLDLYEKYKSDPSLTNDVIKFLTGCSAENADFPRDFGAVAAGIISTVRDRRDKETFRATLQPWEKCHERMSQKGGENYQEMKALLDWVNRFRERHICTRDDIYNHVELASGIDVSS